MTGTIVAHELLRTIIREKCILGRIDLGALTSFCRILLTTDGTLTELLEVNFLEPIHLIKVSEVLSPAPEAIAVLDAPQGELIIDRKILLQGLRSGRNYVYAESIIVVGGLEAAMQHDLLVSKKPIGRLWLDYKMETFKEIVDIHRAPAGQLGTFFGIAPEEPILSRTYRVFSHRRPIILITEKFPEHFELMK